MNTHLISGRTPKVAGSQRGLVVIELALTLPLIVLIMFATAELGRAFYQYTTLTKAVEAGTRYYASDPATIDVPTIQRLVACGHPTTCTSKVLPKFLESDVSAVPDGDHVVVSATYTFAPMLGANLPVVGEIATFTMTASHSQRAL